MSELVDKVAEAIWWSQLPNERQCYYPLPTWAELSGAMRDFYRGVARSAVDAIKTEGYTLVREEVSVPPKCFDCEQVVGSGGDVGDTYAFCDDQCRQAFMTGLL